MSEPIKALLKIAGLKSTPHRIDILHELQNSDDALTVEKLYSLLMERGKRINYSTIYRILDVLVKKQLIVRNHLMNANKALYEIKRDRHCHYIVCTGCHKKIRLDACPIRALENELSSQTGFCIETHHLELYGRCPDCTSSENH